MGDFSANQGEISDLVGGTLLADYSGGMDERTSDKARRRLREVIDARPDVSLRELSASIGKSAGYLSDFLNKNSPTELDLRDALTLAGKLDIPAAELGVDGILGTHPQQMVAARIEGAVTSEREKRPSQDKTLPILGHVKAGEVGFFLDQGMVRGYAMRPESLRDNKDAYAVRVHDESMSERFEPGWILQVDPWRPVKQGDNVIVELHDGQAFVKILVRRTAKVTTCRQLNPRKEIEFKASDVRNVHLVVGVDLIDR